MKPVVWRRPARRARPASSEDVPLIAFTLLAQVAVGSLFVLLLSRLGGNAPNGMPASAAERLWFLIPPGLMSLALVCSLGHLRSFSRSARALFNLRSSWLSREILSGLLFLGSSALFAWTAPPGAGPVTVTAGFAAAVFGLALLFSMASVYRLRTIPAWNTPILTLSFAVTSASLGCLLVAAVRGTAWPWLDRIALAAGLLLIVQSWLQRLWLAGLRRGSEASRRAWTRVNGARGAMPRFRSALAAGAALLALAVAVSHSAKVGAPARTGLDLTGSALICALVLSSASEVLGRILLYRARVRLGL